MNTVSANRLNTLLALRRMEQARALEKWRCASEAAESADAALLAERSIIASLNASLRTPPFDGCLTGAATGAAFADRHRKSRELNAAKEKERALIKEVAAHRSALKAAEDEVARAQKALSALEKHSPSQRFRD